MNCPIARHGRWGLTTTAAATMPWERLKYIMSGESKQQADVLQSWVFQANPRFRLAAAVRELPVIQWAVTRLRNEIRAGHTAYLWLSGRSGGFLAQGRILTDPAMMEDAPEEAVYETHLEGATTPTRGNLGEVQVRIKIEKVFDRPITRRDCLNHPILRAMDVIRSPRPTNFRLTPEQAKALEEALEAATEIARQDAQLMALEGAAYRGEATFRYRNRSLIEKKKQQSDGRCSVCTLRFAERYKGIDKDCLIAHHVHPIGKRKKATRTTLDDIDLLCPNCHAAVHTEDPPLSADQLRGMLIG